MSLPLILSLALLIKDLRDALEFIAWSAVLPAFWIAWLAAFRIDVDALSVSYRQPFFRWTRLKWREVASVEVKRGLGKRSVAVASPFSAVVITAVDGKQRIIINPRPFSFLELQECVSYMQSMIENNASQTAK